MPLVAENIPESCEGCGSCCRLIVHLQPEEFEQYPERDRYFATGKFRCLTTDRLYDGLWTLNRQTNGDCTYLDSETRRCTIYERRPGVCRDFEQGSKSCVKALGRYYPVTVQGKES